MPLCDPLWRRKDRAHDVACYPPGFSPFLGELQPTPRGQYAAMQFWHSGRRDLTCFGSRPPFGPKHTQWDSCLESELASPWPPYPVVPEKVVVSHTVWGVALSWTHTFSFVQKPMMQRWRLKVPSSTTRSLLLPWWMTPHTMSELPSVGLVRACISLFPCLQRTRAQREARRHRKSHFLCVLLHTRLRRLWSKFNLGHLAGCLER